MPWWNKFSVQETELLIDLFRNTYLTYNELAVQFKRDITTIHHAIHALFTKEEIQERKRMCYKFSKLGSKNPYFGVTGKAHPHYKGICYGVSGYPMVLKPDWYTGRKTQKHVFVHHLVLCKWAGITAMPKGWNGHHCDKNKNNNDLSNLVLLTAAAHTKLHQCLLNKLEGATTISKESTLKWVEAHGGGLWVR